MSLNHYIRKVYTMTKLFNLLPNKNDCKGHGGKAFQTNSHLHNSMNVSSNTIEKPLSEMLTSVFANVSNIIDKEEIYPTAVHEIASQQRDHGMYRK